RAGPLPADARVHEEGDRDLRALSLPVQRNDLRAAAGHRQGLRQGRARLLNQAKEAMAKLKGRVRKNDLEGGIWELVAEDGAAYELRGGDAGRRVPGQAVEVEGKVAKAAMGIGMSGPIFDVTGWRKG